MQRRIFASRQQPLTPCTQRSAMAFTESTTKSPKADVIATKFAAYEGDVDNDVFERESTAPPDSGSEFDGQCVSWASSRQSSLVSEVAKFPLPIDDLTSQCKIQGGQNTHGVVPAPVPEMMLDANVYASVGSVGHPLNCAPPCKYHFKRQGCKDGILCSRCHMCVWSRKAAREETKRITGKVAASTQKMTPDVSDKWMPDVPTEMCREMLLLQQYRNSPMYVRSSSELQCFNPPLYVPGRIR